MSLSYMTVTVIEKLFIEYAWVFYTTGKAAAPRPRDRGGPADARRPPTRRPGRPRLGLGEPIGPGPGTGKLLRC